MAKSLHTPAYRAFCQIMVLAREHQRLTQAELALRLDRPQSFVSKYESGERRLDIVEFISVCDALGVEATALFRSVLRETNENKASNRSG